MLNDMRHIIIKSLIAVALSTAMVTAACTKEVVTPIPNSKSEGLYHSLLPLWALRDSPQWPSAVSQYAMTNHFTQVSDSLSGGFRIITYLSQNDTGIYVLRTYNLHDTLWSLHCSLFSPMQTWMQEQMARYETQLYIRHPDGYTGGSFYWFLSPIVRNSVDGGDVRSHDLFVQRVAEHRADVWEWVEARTRYGHNPPYLGEDRLQLLTDGTRYTLTRLGLDSIPSGITHHLEIQFNTYDTTGWSNPFGPY